MEAFAYAVLFFLPAAVGNVTPIFINRVPILNQWKTPIDLGVSWRGKRVFGANKTWRGLVCGTGQNDSNGLITYSVYRARFCAGCALASVHLWATPSSFLSGKPTSLLGKLVPI